MYDGNPLGESGFEPGSKFDASPSAGFGSRSDFANDQFADGSQEGFERGRSINLRDRNHQLGGHESYRSGSRSVERPYGYERQDYGYGNQGKYQNEAFGPYGYGNDENRFKGRYGSEDRRSHYGYRRDGYGSYSRSCGSGGGYDDSMSMYGYGRGNQDSSRYSYRSYGRSGRDSYNPYRYGDYGYGDVKDRSFYDSGRYMDRSYSDYGGYGRDQSPYRHEGYGYGGYGRDQSPSRYERYGYGGYGRDQSPYKHERYGYGEYARNQSPYSYGKYGFGGYARDQSPYNYGKYGYTGYGRDQTPYKYERYGYGSYGRDKSPYSYYGGYGRDQSPYSYGRYGYGGYGRDQRQHNYAGQGFDSYGRYRGDYNSRMSYGPYTYRSGRYSYDGTQPFSFYRPNYDANYPRQSESRYPYHSSPYNDSLYNYRQGYGGYNPQYFGRYGSGPYVRNPLVGNLLGYGYGGYPGYQADRYGYGNRSHGYDGDFDRRRYGMGPYFGRSTYRPPYSAGYQLAYPPHFPSQYGH